MSHRLTIRSVPTRRETPTAAPNPTTTSHALALGVQLMQFGLVQDDSIGRSGYTPGRFRITDYGCEFCEHLGASEVDDANQEAR
jgi:hypothetical protein